MKNQHLWKPSKFIEYKNSFRTTDDNNVVGISYKLIGDIQSSEYCKLIKKYVFGKLLDLGCGNLPLYGMYKDYSNDIISADWSVTEKNRLFLDLRVDLNKGLPIADSTFDTILLTDVLEHIANPFSLWQEMTRILKPDGKLIIGVPFFHLLHEEPFDYFRYTEFSLNLFSKENNLKIIELYPYGGSLEILMDFIAKHLAFSKILSKIYYLFCKALLNTKISKKIYSRTSNKYPLGYCMVLQK